ncbi:MAG: peptidase [Saprospiraceae bacterium]|nr:peptidase [Saprospiraceae bacterium]
MSEVITTRIDKYIDEHQGSAVVLLQELVRHPSTFGNELHAQQVILRKLTDLGLAVDQWEPDLGALRKNPYFVSSREHFKDSPNIVALWKGSGGGRSLLLNGHIDVVPAGERAKWTSDPFSGEQRDGKIYGRGTTDMKGGSVALILAVEAIIRSGARLKGDVIFQSVVDEECGGAGTIAAIERGYHADGAIIPEPTGMKLFVKQQGSMWFRIQVLGLSAHGGTRYEGVSAIELSQKVCEAILQLERDRNASVSDPLYSGLQIPLPINIGRIEGGTWPSSVPDLVTIEGRIGVGPEEDLEQVKSEFRERLIQLANSDPWMKDNLPNLEFFGAQWVPNSVDRDHPLVDCMEKKYIEVYGRQPMVEAAPWATDGGLLTRLGDTPALIIGPGVTAMAHYPDEYIEIDEMIKAARYFTKVIIDWCGLDQ